MEVRKSQLTQGNEVKVSIDGVPLGLGILRRQIGTASQPFKKYDTDWCRETWLTSFSGDLMNIIYEYEKEN